MSVNNESPRTLKRTVVFCVCMKELSKPLLLAHVSWSLWLGVINLLVLQLRVSSIVMTLNYELRGIRKEMFVAYVCLKGLRE
jgi:hypothetical protein